MAVVFLNPKTCGIYKDGGTRYKTDEATGQRTDEIDNELLEHVEIYLKHKSPPGLARVATSTAFRAGILAPTYYDKRYNDGIESLLKANELEGVTLGLNQASFLG